MAAVARATAKTYERCVSHPDGPMYRDPADRRIWRCICCEDADRAHATLSVLDYEDLALSAVERKRLRARLYTRRSALRRRLPAAEALRNARWVEVGA